MYFFIHFTKEFFQNSHNVLSYCQSLYGVFQLWKIFKSVLLSKNKDFNLSFPGKELVMLQPVKQWNANSAFRKVTLSHLFCWCYNWHIKDSIDVNNSFTWFCTGFRYNWQPIFIIFKKGFIKTSASGVRTITEAYVLLTCLTWNTICESASLWLLSSSGISIQPILIWNLISTA